MRFEQAIEVYHDEIFRYIYRRCLASGEAEPIATAADLTQDTFERAYAVYGRLKPDSNVRAWLYAIAGNRARDHHRRLQSSRNYLQSSNVPNSNAAAEQQMQLDEQRQQLYAALAQLPAKQREAVRLRYLGELDYREIGRVLSCSTASARANVYQGLKKLRERMDAFQEAIDDK